MSDPRFNPTLGPSRRSLDRDDAETIDRLRQRDVLVLDERRARSSYFDGRFLAARDLIREQTYALVRQADLARAGSAGVLRGLQVQPAGPTAITLTPGLGFTGTGELASITAPLTVTLANIPDLGKLDLSMGVAPLPAADPAMRNGLFVLALRPVEYARNPVTAFPTSVFGKRGQQDGDIQEAVALVLAPFEDEREPTSGSDARRSALARRLFLDAGAQVASPEVLPLAMLLLEAGVVRWLDPYLVRREVAAERSRVLGLDLVSRAMREAHLLHYDALLQELFSARQAAGRLRFAAADAFQVLPAAGRFPAAAIDGKEFTQSWFPPEMTVELSVVPDDEIAPLVEESLALPPIDLSGSSEDLDLTCIQVLIPLSAAAIGQLRLDTSPRRLGPLIRSLIAKRRPLEILNALVSGGPELADTRIVGVETPAQVLQRTIDAGWQAALSSGGTTYLWYVRARSIELRVAELQAIKDAKDAPEKAAKEAKEAKETKEGKDTKEAKETKEAKDTKEGKDAKDGTKETKEEVKDSKDAKDATKETKELTKDNKDSKDATKETKELTKDNKDSKDATKESKEESKDSKDSKDASKDTKEASKDLKDKKDVNKDTKERSKDNKDNKDASPEKLTLPREKLVAAEKIPHEGGPIIMDIPDRPLPDGPIFRGVRADHSGTSRTFIEPNERPVVGDRALSDPLEEDDE